DIGSAMWYRLEWQGELVDVSVRPDAASERRGADVDPIDFSIDDGVSLVSLLSLTLTHDRRNDPGLPTQGWLANFRGDLAAPFLGSDYSFLRLQGLLRHWVHLPIQDHYVRLGLFGGILFGRAPFFYRF